MIEFISQPWPWYVGGPAIALIMLGLLYFGRSFGVSANLRTMCTIGGAGKVASFFDFDWTKQIWNLVFILGAIIGGAIAHNYLTLDPGVDLASNTVSDLQGLGLADPGGEFVPSALFSWERLFTLKGLVMLVGGGFLVGFGARYAGGCTSGHAISGISNLQIPSMIAVVGFFIGGLLVTYFVLPYLLG
ncbi:MAG: YeeE/YedE family protein [Cyclobacteriaceae bacterium]|nr:YeeE/YedE family protein [Cyclobacteriaceae bacterium]